MSPLSGYIFSTFHNIDCDDDSTYARESEPLPALRLRRRLRRRRWSGLRNTTEAEGARARPRMQHGARSFRVIKIRRARRQGDPGVRLLGCVIVRATTRNSGSDRGRPTSSAERTGTSSYAQCRHLCTGAGGSGGGGHTRVFPVGRRLAAAELHNVVTCHRCKSRAGPSVGRSDCFE